MDRYEKTNQLKKKLYHSDTNSIYQSFLSKVLDFFDPSLISPLEALIITNPKKNEILKPSLLRKAAYSKALNGLKDKNDFESEIKINLLKALYVKEAGEISYRKLIGEY